MSGSVRFSEIEPFLVDVDSDDCSGSHSFRYAHCEKTDGSGTHDKNVHSSSTLTLVCNSVNSNGEWLHHGSVNQVDRVRELVHQVVGSVVRTSRKWCSQLVISLQSPVKWRIGSKSHMFTNLHSAQPIEIYSPDTSHSYNRYTFDKSFQAPK
jgi:hypothetical protein